MGGFNGAGPEFVKAPEEELEILTKRIRQLIVENLDYATKSKRDKERFEKRTNGLIELSLKIRSDLASEGLSTKILTEENREGNRQASDVQIELVYIQHDDDDETYSQKMQTAKTILEGLCELSALKVPFEAYQKLVSMFDTISEKNGRKYSMGRYHIELAMEAVDGGYNADTRAELVRRWVNTALDEKDRHESSLDEEDYAGVYAGADEFVQELGGEHPGDKLKQLHAFFHLASEITELKWRVSESTTDNPEGAPDSSDIENWTDLTISMLADVDLLESYPDGFRAKDAQELLLVSGLDDVDIRLTNLNDLLGLIAERTGNEIVDEEGELVIRPRQDK